MLPKLATTGAIMVICGCLNHERLIPVGERRSAMRLLHLVQCIENGREVFLGCCLFLKGPFKRYTIVVSVSAGSVSPKVRSERYLRTGESDPYRSAWSGGFLQREKRAHDDLRNALVRAARRLTAGLSQEPLPESDTIC
jgi:hypothetical protein